MSDLVKIFAFDIQRFANNTFKGGKVEGEEGITLSSLFNSAGRVWQTTDVESLANRTFFWENQGEEQENNAPVQLTPAENNAPGKTAGGLTLVKGVYDDPTKIGDKTLYPLKSIEVIDAENLNGRTAKFSKLEGVEQIVNVNGKFDITGDGLGAINFNNGGIKTQDDDLDWAVGNVVELNNGKIVDAKATTGEEITTADGTKATFVNGGGKATFAGDSFDTIETFAKDGTSELNVSDDADNIILEIGNMVTDVADGETVAKADLNGKAIESIELNATSADVVFGGASNVGNDINIAGGAVNVAGVAASSASKAILYKYKENADDIIDLTFTEVATDATVTVTKTGSAGFVVANDVSESDVDITIGDTSYKFGDVGENGGVFVVAGNQATGFIFRDVGDSITIQKNQAMPNFFDSNPTTSTSDELAMSISSKGGNESFDLSSYKEVLKGLSSESELTITKTEEGYSVKLTEDGAKITTEDGTTITFNKNASANEAVATVNFTEDGKLQNIDTKATDTEETGSDVKGTAIKVDNLTAAGMAEGFSINNEEISIDEGTDELIYEKTVHDDGSTTTKTNAAEVDDKSDEKKNYEVAGVSGTSDLPTIEKDANGIITSISDLSGNVSVTTSAEGGTISVNGASFTIEDAKDGTQYTFTANGIYGLRDGDVVQEAGTSTQFFTVEEGTFTILGTSVVIAGDSSVGFDVANGALTGVTGLSGTATGDFGEAGLTFNGASVEVTGDENKSIKVVGNDTGITAVGNLSGSAVDVAKADGATAVGADGDGQFTFSYKSGETFAVKGNGDVETFFGIADNVNAITGLDNGETVSGKFDNGIKVGDDAQEIKVVNGGAAGISVANVAGKLVINGLSAGAVLTAADGVSTAIAEENGNGAFTFAGNQKITVSGDTDGYIDFTLDGEGRVIGIDDLDGKVSGDLNGVKINGEDIDIEVIGTNGRNTHLEVDYPNKSLSGLDSGDTVISADHLETVHAGNGSYTFKQGTFNIENDADNNVDFYIAAGTTSVVGISGLNSSTVTGAPAATVEGKLSNVDINNAGIEVTETASSLGGDGRFKVTANEDATNITKIEELGGTVVVNNAGNAAQFVTNAQIDLTDAADKNYKVEGDTNVTFDVENSAVKDIRRFGDVPATLTMIDTDGTIATSVDGAYIEVVHDGDDVIRYEADGLGNYSLKAVDDGDNVGTSINAIGRADVVQTSGDGKYTFFGDQTFKLEGEGEATELDAQVNYWVDGSNRIRRINELDGNITGNFEEAITVNSADITNPAATDDVIQVLDDKEIVVSGDAKSTQPASVSAIDKVSDKASIVSTGRATVVGTDTEGVFTFDNGATDAKYTVDNDSEVKFLMQEVTLTSGSVTGAVYGVDELKDGTIVLDDDENGKTFIVNPDVNDSITMVSANKVSLTTDANGKLATIAGLATGINETVAGINGVRDVTIIATEAIGINDQYVDVTDADGSFQIVVDKDGKVTEITDVTGDATINLTNVEKAVVTTDKQGKFVIDKEYTFNDDSDGVIQMTIFDGDLKYIDSLNGAVIIDELSATATTAADISVNGSAIAFDSKSTLAVTVATDGSSITAVDGLADMATIAGDLDIASIAVPGNGSDLDSTDNGSIVEITINNDPYTLAGDPSGVTINGARAAEGLDEEGELIVGNAGTYTVNAHNQALAADTNDTIVGYDSGAYAEIFDADKVLIRGDNVYTDVIEYRLGLHKYSVLGGQATEFDGGDQVGGPDYTRTSTDADPLSREDTESLFAAAEAGEWDLDRPLEVYADNYDIELGAASRIPQTLNFSGYDFSKKLHLYRGDQEVTVNSFGGNEVLVEDVSDVYTSGEKRITLGGGESSNEYKIGDVVIVDAAKAIDSRVSITGGAGKDSVYVRNNIDVVFDMGGSLGGDDKLITYASSNARVSLENYDPINTKAGIQIEEAHLRDANGGIANAVITDKILKFGDGMVSVTTTSANGDINTAEIDFGDNSVIGGTLVYLYTPEGTRQGVGFTHSNGGSVDSSQMTDDMILIGNKDGSKKSIESVQSAIWATVIGGVGNDTVLAGEGDFINAGDGNNLVSLENDSTRGGAEIVLNDGNTIIENTNNTFYADHGDTLDVDDPANINFDTDSSNLIVRGTGYNATIVAPDHDSIEGATSTDSVGVNIGSTYVNQLVKDANGKVWKMAVGASDAVIDVKDDEDIRADYYKGGAVTFENYDGFGPVLVDLSNDENSWGSKIDGVEVKFDGVVSVEAGESDTTIKGSEANEWFFAGKGKSSLYGAGGKNLLVGFDDGAQDNSNKEGSTTFFILGQADTGVNTIESFAFVNDNNYTNNSIVADMIEIDTANNFVAANSVEISNQDIVFSVENRTTGVRESVLVKDAASSYEDDHVRDFRITDSVIAQVADDDLYFDKFANFYMATGKNATVKVSNDQDYSRVWLANPAIGSTFVGDIHVIDATDATVTAELAGNDYNNTILAGSGDTSLWGGNFGDDLLIGGEGKNTFYYQKGLGGGNGADTIQGAKAGDVIDLTGYTIADIEAGVALGISKIDETGVSIGFANGGTLRVDGTAADVNYVVEGQTYTLNEDRTLFVKKS